MDTRQALSVHSKGNYYPYLMKGPGRNRMGAIKRYLRDIVSFVAALVALMSLGITTWSARNAHEREFLYKSYDQLAELAIVVHGHNENSARQMNAADRAASSEEATKLLHQFRVEDVNAVTRAKQQLDIHQLALDEATLRALTQLVEDVHKRHDQWDQASKKDEATTEDVIEYYNALGRFWAQMNQAVGTAMNEVARRLRR